MLNVKKVLLLLASSQLGACAVISKTECLNADWQQIGYDVASKGDSNKSDAFALRKSTCEKHGANANWQQFSQGHSDGTVDYCQLTSAVEHGVYGATKAINDQICPEQDYPGFQQAFNAGYKLYVLNTRVQESHADISRINSLIENKRHSIHGINTKLSSKTTNQHEKKSLRHTLKKHHLDIRYLIHDLDDYHQRLHHDVYLKDEYSDYIYNDYIVNINKKFVDPRYKTN